MENNEISMLLDVKLDLKDKKAETANFRNWTKCNVKIEAIKCFPCYFRITFTKISDDRSDTLCVRINIPGLSVRFANSRSRTYSYGLFWKQNRKRCCIFFGHDSQLSCERHMKWVKKSIKNLELHRQEILETRRLSRSKPELPIDGSKSLNEFDRKDIVKNLQDILGPLPKIPDFNDGNWSRRVSGMSGIYEEIQDGDSNSRRFSRNSLASGIYEEMKPVSTFERIREHFVITPPPLPPRKRINTFLPETGEISRSHTNPESDLAKKKKYLTVLESMFGLSKRSSSLTDSKENLKISPDKKIGSASKKRGNNLEVIQLSSKRNSFSSPDLTKMNCFDAFDALDDLSSVSSELHMMGIEEVNASDEFIHISPNSFNKINNWQNANISGLNISEQIQPNFNISCNSSTVNLVGSSMNSEKNNSVGIVDDLSGYCTMAPIKKDRDKSANDGNKENEEIVIPVEDNHNQFDADVYENMNALSRIYLNDDDNIKSSEHIYLNEDANNKSSEHVYQNVTSVEKVNNSIKLNSSDIETQTQEDDSKKLVSTHRKSNSVDDKIPSYYPNDCDIIKNRRRSSINDKNPVRHLNGIKVTRHENLYITSPKQKKLDETKCCDTKHKNANGIRRNAPLIKASKTPGNIYVVTKIPDNNTNEGKTNPVISVSIDESPVVKNVENVKNQIDDNNLKFVNNERSPRMYQKYATLARISPNKYLEKCAKKTSEFSNVKKFTSLPRFKKIDLSPLKMKITNVLQRHHSDGF